MINKDKMKEVLIEYKKDFMQLWKNEKYKWQAIKQFQDNWDINAPDFLSMFTVATDKTYNLLTSMHYYPRGMIQEFIKVDAEEVRSMFIELFDESIDLATRISSFQERSEVLQVKYDQDGSWKSHYQGANAITTYLWLRYPDKYYIYKYSGVKEVAKVLESSYVPKKGAAVSSVLGCIKLYNEIAIELSKEKEFISTIMSMLDASCYPDLELRTLTIDFCFYISTHYNQKKEAEVVNTSEYWPPIEVYNPNISKDEWKCYILEVEKPDHPCIMQMLKAMTELGGAASCKKLSTDFGGHPSSYVGDTINLGKRAKKYFNLSACMDGKQERLFAIPFLRKEITEDEKKSYEYKMRPELLEALKEIDLSDVSPQYSDLESAEDDSSWELNEATSQELQNEYMQYSKEEFLDEVYMKPERYDTLVALLKNRKNLILQGAPGVGKTFAAKRLAYSILGEINEDHIEFVQFHQNYSYEDFIMGYKPDENGFKLTPGVFYRFCKKAENHPNDDYFFIIDEINRGNMSKIFGELLMLIEKDYRNTNVTLAYNGMPFHVPSNVYIIGMMNTADRSLAMIDYALRRRFSFFEMEPGFTSEGFKKYQNDLNNETFNLLIQKIIELNRAIEQDDSLGAGFRIGHSYFCGQTECSEDWMKCVVNYDIIPMLEEYWFDDKQSLTKWSNQLKGVFDD